MDEAIEVKKASKPIERVTVAESLKDKLAILVTQATDSLQGIASVNKSDIVNLLIEDHPDKLSDVQIGKLKSTHIDQVKYALWIAQRLKAARDAGEPMTIQELLAQSQSVVNVANTATGKRTRRKRKPNGEIGSEPKQASSLNEEQAQVANSLFF